jgi:hypothetical protein
MWGDCFSRSAPIIIPTQKYTDGGQDKFDKNPSPTKVGVGDYKHQGAQLALRAKYYDQIPKPLIIPETVNMFLGSSRPLES